MNLIFQVYQEALNVGHFQRALGLGQFPYHTWHKEEREDIVSNVGLKIEYGEALEHGEDKGTCKTVGDLEHVQIISMYAGEGLGMQKIATQKGRSTRTIQVHIVQHNEAVRRSSFCTVCKRANSSYFNREAKRTKPSLDGSQIVNEAQETT